MAEQRGSQELEALLEHTTWLRGLARALLGEAGGDGGAADDLVQDALVVALEREAPAGNPRSWLAGVLRNVARRRRRADGRRRERERERASPGPQPGAAEVLARADLQRRLIGHVFALAEPYRAAVLLRYFEGLSAAQVAQRLGVPASTARTRVARGLDQLRARLDAEHGGAREVWSAAFAPLALWTGEAAPAAAGIGWGVLGMGAKAKAAAAAAVAVLGATAFVLRGADGPADPRADGAGQAPAELADLGRKPGGGAATSAAGAASAADGRRPVAAAEAAPAPADLGVLVFGAVLGAGGEPVASGTIDLVDAQGRAARGSVGAPGSWSAVGLQPGTYELFTSCKGYVETSSAFAIPDGARELRHDLRVDAASAIPVRFTDEAGAPRKRKPRGLGRVQPVVVATRERPPPVLPGLGTSSQGRYGSSTYETPELFESIPGLGPEHAGLLRLRAAPPLWVSAVLGDQVLESRRLDGPAGELVFVLSAEREQALLGGVRLRLVDAVSGEPVPGARLSLEGGFGDAVSDDGGRALLAQRAPGPRTLQVLATGFAILQRGVRVPPGAELDLGDVALRASTEVAGRVVDERGEPVSTGIAWQLLDGAESALDGECSGFERSAFDGSFRLACARGRCALRVSADGFACDPLVVDAAAPIAGLVLQARRGTEVRFWTRSGAAPGTSLTLATGDGLPFLSRPAAARIPVALRLSAGRYQLWIGRDGEVLERMPFEVPAESPEEGLLVAVPSLEPSR